MYKQMHCPGLGLLLTALIAGAQAQTYPNRDIILVVPPKDEFCASPNRNSAIFAPDCVRTYAS